MDHQDARRLVEEGRVARVGTIDGRGRVHLVPIVYVLEGDTLYSSTDAGPPAKRLRNLESNPAVTVIVDVYDEDWSKVWWVRLSGVGRRIDEGPEYDLAYRMLWAKYSQYTDEPAGGPIMAVDIEKWSFWAYSTDD